MSNMVPRAKAAQSAAHQHALRACCRLAAAATAGLPLSLDSDVVLFLRGGVQRL